MLLSLNVCTRQRLSISSPLISSAQLSCPKPQVSLRVFLFRGRDSSKACQTYLFSSTSPQCPATFSRILFTRPHLYTFRSRSVSVVHYVRLISRGGYFMGCMVVCAFLSLVGCISSFNFLAQPSRPAGYVRTGELPGAIGRSPDARYSVRLVSVMSRDLSRQ